MNSEKGELNQAKRRYSIACVSMEDRGAVFVLPDGSTMAGPDTQDLHSGHMWIVSFRDRNGPCEALAPLSLESFMAYETPLAHALWERFLKADPAVQDRFFEQWMCRHPEVVLPRYFDRIEKTRRKAAILVRRIGANRLQLEGNKAQGWNVHVAVAGGAAVLVPTVGGHYRMDGDQLKVPLLAKIIPWIGQTTSPFVWHDAHKGYLGNLMPDLSDLPDTDPD